mgnify:FL=1
MSLRWPFVRAGSDDHQFDLGSRTTARIQRSDHAMRPVARLLASRSATIGLDEHLDAIGDRLEEGLGSLDALEFYHRVLLATDVDQRNRLGRMVL